MPANKKRRLWALGQRAALRVLYNRHGPDNNSSKRLSSTAHSGAWTFVSSAQQTPEQPVKRAGWFENVWEIGMKLNAFATIALFVGLVFASSAYSQPAQTGGPTPSPPGAKVEFIDLKDGAIIARRKPTICSLNSLRSDKISDATSARSECINITPPTSATAS